MIAVRNLVKTIRNAAHEVQIIRDISFDVPSRQFVAIMGPSGSGKSTLLGLIAGLDAPTSGSIMIDGHDIGKLREDELAKLRGQKLGFVFQSYHLIPTLTAFENVTLPMEFSGVPNGTAGARAEHLLESVGLVDRRDHYPVQLSGGEQQRVALARAFIMKPAVLLADEPTGNLDSENGRHVLELLIRLNQEEGATLVLVTHDELLASNAERRIVLRDGRIVEDSMKDHPKIRH
jgi:putative ABC transport system ATP-binding protein